MAGSLDQDTLQAGTRDQRGNKVCSCGNLAAGKFRVNTIQDAGEHPYNVKPVWTLKVYGSGKSVTLKNCSEQLLGLGGGWKYTPPSGQIL